MHLASQDLTVFLCFPPVTSTILLVCSLGIYVDGIGIINVFTSLLTYVSQSRRFFNFMPTVLYVWHDNFKSNQNKIVPNYYTVCHQWSNKVCRVFRTPSSVNSLKPHDTIWWQRSKSTLAQVMACWLTAPSNYLNKCLLIISKVYWHSSEGNFVRDTSATIHKKLAWKLPT